MQALMMQCTRFSLINIQVRITHLAVVHCPKLATFSLAFHSPSKVSFSVKERVLPCCKIYVCLQEWHIIWYQFQSQLQYIFESTPHPGLQKLIQSQHQLKTITIRSIAINMSSLFKLLESQSKSLESIVLTNNNFCQDNSNIELIIKFHQQTSFCIK